MDIATLEALMRETQTDGYAEDLMRLAEAIEAFERERCAQVACAFLTQGRSPHGMRVAEAIRAITASPPPAARPARPV